MDGIPASILLLQSGIRVPFPEKGGGQNLLEKINMQW